MSRPTADDRCRARVHVGTEAALHRVTEADAVAFLDFDQELLAPRYRAAEEAFALLARAPRGWSAAGAPGRACSCRPECPNHEVLDAALHADPARVQRCGGPTSTRSRLPAREGDGSGLGRGRRTSSSRRSGAPPGDRRARAREGHVARSGRVVRGARRRTGARTPSRGSPAHRGRPASRADRGSCGR